MLNSEFVIEQAELFANEVVRQGGRELPRQVEFVLRRTLQRNPSADEVRRGVQFIERLRRDHALAPHDALRQFCLVALNMNEFIYVE
jgi:hypothetical protein